MYSDVSSFNYDNLFFIIVIVELENELFLSRAATCIYQKYELLALTVCRSPSCTCHHRGLYSCQVYVWVCVCVLGGECR